MPLSSSSETGKPQTRYRQALAALLVFSLAMIALVWTMTQQRLDFERTQTLDYAQAMNDNLLLVLGAQVESSLDNVSETLSLVGDLYQAGYSRQGLDHLLKQVNSQSRVISAIGVIDGAGKPAIATRDVAAGSASLIDPSFKRLHRTDRQGLLVGKPLREPVSRNWVIPVSQPIDKPDGSLAGVAYAFLRPAYFFNIFEQAKLSSQDLVLLLGTDGIARALHRDGHNSLGEDLHALPLFAAQGRQRNGSFLDAGVFTGITHMVSYRSIAGYSLIVAVGTSEIENLAIFRERQSSYYGKAALASALILVFSAALLAMLVRQRRVETKVVQLSGLYAALSQSNQAIVKSRNETTLFAEVCRIMVQTGGAKLAWIGLVDAASPWLMPAASCGAGMTFINEVRIAVAGDTPTGNSVASTAIREQQPIWSQDYLHDPRSAAWHEQAARYGWAAVAALPLSRDGAVIGMLAVFSGTKAVFDQPVRELLIEISTDISYALAEFARGAERKARTRELRSLSRAVAQSPVSIVIANLQGNIEYVNPKFEQVTGYSSSEAIGQNPKILSSGEKSAEEYRKLWATITSGNIWRGEFHNRRKNGTLFWELATISPILDESGKIISFVAVKEDITEHKAALEQIQQLAFADPLTHLPNRRLLMDRLRQALAGSSRSGHGGALLFIDLDNFKTLNDTRGHEVGDLLLQQVAQRLSTCVRESDTVARLGGDEFVVILEDLSEDPREAATRAEAVGKKILAVLGQAYGLAGHDHYSTPSIGVALFADHHDSFDELLKRADVAMYQAKAAGRNTLRFFDPQMQAMIMADAALEVELRQGILNDQFLLHYQPQVGFDGRMIGAEALLRWQHPERGMVSPAEFIPLAEETGLILQLGYWVLEIACRQLKAWAGRAETRHLSLAVNVSARQFRHPDFVDQVLAVLDHTGADPLRLKLELTESLLLHNVEEIIEKMNTLKARGISFSLDDFGTGYSSLAYLKRLPLYQLKIDQSFVRDLLTDPNDAAIARTIVALAQSLGLAVIAEGVETEAQRGFLAANGCHAYQGYLFSKPLPLAELEQLIDARPRAGIPQYRDQSIPFIVTRDSPSIVT